MKEFFKKIKDFDPYIIFEKVSKLLELLHDQSFKIKQKIAATIDKIGAAFYNFGYQKRIYKWFRYLSFPWHFILIIIYVTRVRLRNRGKLIYDQPGIHVIFGAPGTGKSSLSFELIERIRLKTKMKPSYINYPFEKQRLSEDESYWFRYHNLYSFDDHFKYNTMRKRFNHIVFGSIVIDEAHSIFNARNNRTREYNDVFGPFIEYSTKIRQHMGHIYMLTQMGRMDIQIMMLAQSITEVEIDIGFDYPDWLRDTGLFRFKPLKWRLKEYKINSFGELNQKRFRKFVVKNEYANLDYFDSFATRNDYDHVPLDYPSNYEIKTIGG
ncbi:MAG TPA: zonular occludens toxin domain-containing protein [Edaphocola sp.]|nr:zonular occludens toxin domain-containing protein [Edaphocola sp.]